MKKKKRRSNFLVRKLNNLRLRQKLMIMQVFCVVLPLLISDTVLIGVLISAETKANEQEMLAIADSVKYTITQKIETALDSVQSVYANRAVNEFIQKEYETPLEYYEGYNGSVREAMSAVSANHKGMTGVIYAANETLISGGSIQPLSKVENEYWYLNLLNQRERILVFPSYQGQTWESKRTVSIARMMDYYQKGAGKDVIKMELDYAGILNTLTNTNYSSKVYVCDGFTIVFSNDDSGGVYSPFEVMDMKRMDNAAAHVVIGTLGCDWDVYVMPVKTMAFDTLTKYWPMLLGLFSVNIILPIILMHLINASFTQRFSELDRALENAERDQIDLLPEVSGADEISVLMESYNRMAQRINHLIQNEYKDRLRQQEDNIARQKAELLALHSQINPHFLFNALESIRMHSVIKKEYETADMVEKLAMMHRQNVEWGNDLVDIRDEIRFVEAYLELQKYRFGNKLRYEINVEPDCECYKVPKLTIVTFAENACVHGMENKTSSGWVFVRIFTDRENLIIEVEDTGNGMPEEESMTLMREMNSVKIDMLKENRRIGVLNAALRLKMYSDNKAQFELESEYGAGTMVTITIPLAVLGEKNE